MRQEMMDRVFDAANTLIEDGGTLRTLAEKLGTNRQTLHTDLNKVLPELDPELYEKVRKVLDKNKRERGQRGGLALKDKRDKAKMKKV